MSAALEARLSALESELREARLRIAQLEARRVRPVMHLGSTDSDPLLPADGEIWYRNDSDKLFLRRNGANVDVQDHGSGNGLADDDHAQYALLAGRSGGQTLIGGTASGDDLTLKSTSNATKGTVFLGTASAYDETNDRLGLGMTGPSNKLDVTLATTGTERAGKFAFTDTRTSTTANIPAALEVTYTDAATANRLSAQCFRFVFTKNSGSTGVSTAFDVLASFSSNLNDSLSTPLYGLIIDGPVVASGKTLSSWAALYIPNPQGAGTTTTKYGIVSGTALQHGLGTTAPTATLHVSGTTKLDGGDATVRSDTATPAGGSSSARLLFGTTSGFGIYYGSGAPSVSAAKGSLYLRSDGAGTTSRLYVNTDGSTTWTAVTTVA